MLRRDDGGISDEIVVVRGPHSAGKAEPIHDDRCRLSRKHFGPRVLGVPVEINQDVDAVFCDLGSGRIVIEVVDVAPMVDRILGALLGRIGSLDAARIGEDLEVLVIVLLHDVGHGEAHGVFAQIGRHIADAEPQRIAPTQGRLRTLYRLRHADGLLGVMVRLGELEHRIVGEIGQRQRRNSREQRFSIDALPWRDHRPLALALPQRNPMLHDLGLATIDVETLPERVFGGGVSAVRLQDPAGLLQRGEFV